MSETGAGVAGFREARTAHPFGKVLVSGVALETLTRPLHLANPSDEDLYVQRGKWCLGAFGWSRRPGGTGHVGGMDGVVVDVEELSLGDRLVDVLP